MQGVASMHADGSRAGVFVPASLLRTAFKGVCGTDAPEPGWSGHSTSVPGGLERARVRCRDVPSSPSSGPVYGGPYVGSVLAPMYYHVLLSHGAKTLRTRFLPGLLARFAHSVRPGPPRYRVVNPSERNALRFRDLTPSDNDCPFSEGNRRDSLTFVHFSSQTYG